MTSCDISCDIDYDIAKVVGLRHQLGVAGKASSVARSGGRPAGLPQQMPPAMSQCGKQMAHVNRILTNVCEGIAVFTHAPAVIPAVNRCGKTQAMTSCDISCDIGNETERTP